MGKKLQWPLEASNADSFNGFHWQQSGSNLCLDFHGDPVKSKLVVFSDGNHHMALEECCQTFLKQNPEIVDILYATTPPKVILQSTLQGSVSIGNLLLSVSPNVFISPENILDKLVEENLVKSHQAFAQSRGNALLIKKGNPKNIKNVADLLRNDIQLTISNPVTEKASYDVYKETLINAATEQNINPEKITDLIGEGSERVIFGESIHHREVPQTIFSGKADVAVVYYHLALRYSRIFPDDFEFIEIETRKNVTTDYHIGLVKDGGDWGKRFIEFMFSEAAREIYQNNGLTHS